MSVGSIGSVTPMPPLVLARLTATPCRPSPRSLNAWTSSVPAVGSLMRVLGARAESARTGFCRYMVSHVTRTRTRLYCS